MRFCRPGDIESKLRLRVARSGAIAGSLLMMAFLSPPARAASYFIDNSSASCSDDGAHTAEQPWCDFATLNTTTFQPGDAIYLKAGDVWNQPIVLNGSGSEAGGSISLTSYGSGKKPKVSYGSNTPVYVVSGTNISYWQISGLEIEDTSTIPFDPSNSLPTSGALVFYFDGAGPYSNIEISNNVIHGTGTSHDNILLNIYASYPSRTTPVVQNISITDNTMYDAGRSLVYINGQVGGKSMTYRTGGYVNVTFSGNKAYNSALQGVVLGAIKNGVVSDNLVHDTGLYTGSGETWGPVGLWSVGSSHITFANNEVYRSFDGSTGYDGSGIDVDWDNSYVTVRSNYLHDNQGAGVEVLSSDHTSVIYNRLYNNSGKTNMPAQISLNDYSAGEVHGITNAAIAHNVVILSRADSTALSTTGTKGYVWGGNSYSNNYVLFADSSRAYDLEIDGVGAMAAVNHNSFYSSSGKSFEASIDGKGENDLADWRSSSHFDTASAEAVGTSFSQQEADFAPGGHTGNRWSYLYSENDESSFSSMKWNAAAELWEGTEPNCVIGAGWEQPGGSSCDAVLNWVATADGMAIVGTDSPISVHAGCGGRGVKIRILLNNDQIWPSSGWKTLANGASYAFPALSTHVKAKDHLRFVIQHAGSNNNCDSTYWNPTVLFHP